MPSNRVLPPASLPCTLLLMALAGCGLEQTPEGTAECTPREIARGASPDGAHILQRWESICGFPGSTVTDVVTVAARPIASPPGRGSILFDEDSNSSGGRGQISASWVVSGHVKIVIDVFGEVRESPHEIAGVAIEYALGPSIGLPEIDHRIQAAIDERRHLERLKTSSSWSYVESIYERDARLIDRFQEIKRWISENVEK